MTPIADSDLSNVTGQAGVNINANLSMDIAIGTMAWGDSDGITSVYNPWTNNGTTDTTDGGYVGITDFNMTNLVIKARTEADDNYGGFNTLMLKPITIDVATVTGTNNLYVTTMAAVPTAIHGFVATEDLAPGTTFVRFGLGALKISMDALQFDVALAPRVGTGETAGNQMVTLDQVMGTVSMGGMAVYINPWSYVDIYSAGQGATSGNINGVCFAVNVTIDKFDMGYMSWGDKDGFAAGNVGFPGTTGGTNYWMNNGTEQSAGYVGLDNLYVGAIAINGTVQIDVTTSAGGVYNSVPAYVNSLASHSVSIATEGDLLVGLWNAAPALGGLTTARAGFVGAQTAALTTAYYLYTHPTSGAAGTMGLADFETAAFLKYLSEGGNVGGVTQSTVEGVLEALATGWYNGTTPDAAVSVVHISFPTDFIIAMDGPITAAVKIGNTADFKTGGGITTDAATLGDIYLSGMKIDIYPGSWVDIWAH